MLRLNFFTMKYLLFFASFIGIFTITFAEVHAAPSNFNVLCGGEIIQMFYDPAWPDSQKKPALLGDCLNHIKQNNKTGAALLVQELNAQTGGPLSGGFSYTSNFCWCSVPGSQDSCSPVQLIGSNDQTECNTRCSQGGDAVSRRFESRYKDYQGTSDNNKCGNYCWCMQPTAATGTETRCTLHRDTPRTIGGQEVRIPLTSQTECNTLCSSITVGTRTGSAKQYQTTYRDYSGSSDCSAASAASTAPETSGTGSSFTQRTTTPAPTVRLFNPLSGATTIVDIVNRIIKLMLGIVGSGALLMFVYGGFSWMMAGGDSGKLSTAKTILLNSTLGILLLIFSYAIVSTFFSILR